jgi:hypothetical protein
MPRCSRRSALAIRAFDVALAYDVLREIEDRRVAAGWRPVGRKIGFTNRTIWPRYGVYLPLWAHVWAHTVHRAGEHRATLSLATFVQPRIEPEVVFGLKDASPRTPMQRQCSRQPNGSPPGSRSCRAISPTGSSRRPTARRHSGCTRRSWSARQYP